MSQRHRNQDLAPPPKVDARAHAHNERHRINSELQAVAAQVSAGYEPDEVHEPGRAWVPPHHHDAERGKKASAPKAMRHWKVKDWKRRTNQRLARIRAQRLIIEQS